MAVHAGAAGAASTSRVLLAEKIFNGSELTWTSGTLSSGYSSLEIEFVGRSQLASANTWMGIRLNGDSTANAYKLQRAGHTGTTNTGQFLLTDRWQLDLTGNSSNDANCPTVCTIRIPDPFGTTFLKAMSGTASVCAGVNNYYAHAVTGYWSSTAAISTVTLFHATANFVANSTVRIWGLL